MLKKCLACPKTFISRTKRNKYCSRKCFEQNYFKKEKVFPIFKCSHCRESTQLNFHPTQERIRMDGFECPKCGEKNQ